MTNAELIETVQAMIDDHAARGGEAGCGALAYVLESLATAATFRSAAIGYRLAGQIQDATRCEAQSDNATAAAAARR